MKKIKQRKDCRLCHKTNLKSVLNLGRSPLANNFLSDPNISPEQFRLELFQCQDCGFFQLIDIVNPELMFSNYIYKSGTSKLMRDHFNNYANDVITSFKLQP